jgi:hypothetical protein
MMHLSRSFMFVNVVKGNHRQTSLIQWSTLDSKLDTLKNGCFCHNLLFCVSLIKLEPITGTIRDDAAVQAMVMGDGDGSCRKGEGQIVSLSDLIKGAAVLNVTCFLGY